MKLHTIFAAQVFDCCTIGFFFENIYYLWFCAAQGKVIVSDIKTLKMIWVGIVFFFLFCNLVYYIILLEREREDHHSLTHSLASAWHADNCRYNCATCLPVGFSLGSIYATAIIIYIILLQS